ncbi:hypothetical protein MJN51_41140, partial [Salmonella enterica subsp. enterica serovar Kentucky]|nr:hypothetical protein [Salmonella enterica subsp. enterica serovar Kentucky]
MNWQPLHDDMYAAAGGDNKFYREGVFVSGAAQGYLIDKKLLFKISTGMVLTKLLVVAALGVSMVGMWHLYNIGALPPMAL